MDRNDPVGAKERAADRAAKLKKAKPASNKWTYNQFIQWHIKVNGLQHHNIVKK